MEIHLANHKGRDATVRVKSVTAPLRIRWLDGEERQATSRRMLQGTIDRGLEALKARFGEGGVRQALISGDPEVDLEKYGTFLEETSGRVYVNSKNEVAHRPVHWEVVRAPDGEVKERRPRTILEPNVATDVPLRWTGRMLPRSQVYKRFVFSRKMQIIHGNGLTYDFLYGMAKDLAEKDSLVLVAAGPKGNERLIFRRGSPQYRGFLEGRIDGEKYALILHLSNMELKRPEVLEDE